MKKNNASLKVKNDKKKKESSKEEMTKKICKFEGGNDKN